MALPQGEATLASFRPGGTAALRPGLARPERPASRTTTWSAFEQWPDEGCQRLRLVHPTFDGGAYPGCPVK